MTPRPILALFAMAAMTGGCERKLPEGSVVVSVIGPSLELADPGRGRAARPDAALLGAVAQGLVRFDASGQIAPGLAIRWAISDDGLYYTFRIDRGGTDADKVAQLLRRRIAGARTAALGPILDGIEDVVAVTPEVIEVRLSAPRPDLMTALARPELAILLDGKGSGPLRLTSTSHGTMNLDPVPDLDDRSGPHRSIRLRGERVGLAVARFAAGKSQAMLGGSFADYAYATVAALPPRAIQFDPARGLFGFAIRRAGGILSSAEGRQALSMALDRDAIGAALTIPGWISTEAILPEGVSDIPAPTRPLWARALANVRGGTAQLAAGRSAAARRFVATWAASHDGDVPVIALYLPDGPGSHILFHRVAAQWRDIGIRVERAERANSADLVLVDEVSPSDQADWFLAHFRCGSGAPCSEEADGLFAAARATLDSADRVRLLAQAEAKLADVTPFLPLAQPVRWSLVVPGLEGFAVNPRAAHPLAPLIGR